MVHPLSAEEELVRYMDASRSVAVLTLDQFASKLEMLIPRTQVRTLILTGIEDGLSGIKKPVYKMTKGRNIPRRPSGGKLLRYTDLLEKGRGYTGEYETDMRGGDIAGILYSGGTSGTTKGILLTNLNFNALAMQTEAAGNCVVQGNKMLAIMPVFHGFGLGVCIHTAFITGVTAILVPQFSIKSYAQLLRKYKPHYIAGVPTLYEALLRLGNIEKLDMSQLMGVFSGGDSLSIELKRKVDAFLLEHGAKVQVREGYGLTECVTASCLTPRDFHKEGSIGIPYPDTFYKIVKQGTQELVPYGEEGEITLSGPTVMKGYDNNDEETAQTLRTHADGRVWLHTGDLGIMDGDGFIYFRQRIKRMIISSGYGVYPSQLENVIEAHESVLISCVIGVPDDYKIQRIKAFIVLRDGKEPTEEIKVAILEHCRKNIAQYAMPREFEYRKELPRTLIGKVAYIELEKEEMEKHGQKVV
jgi:long-chain acyl-CoA synthetase